MNYANVYIHTYINTHMHTSISIYFFCILDSALQQGTLILNKQFWGIW